MKRTCPECSKVTEFSALPKTKQADLLGRQQYQCGRCKAVCVEVSEEMTACGTGESWENNLLQFARLVSEIRAIVPFNEGAWDELMESMGLNSDQLSELFERAQLVWEQSKEIDFRAKKKEWRATIACTDERVWMVENKDGKKVVILPPLPYQAGPRIARILALALNTEPSTMVTDLILMKG